MRLIEQSRTIERYALNEETPFTIKAIGKAFRILSSALYQDKIRAIVRELACNAYDAHVAAGWPERPFQVHLPNALEPFFAVRDSGVGLSPDEMITVYTTYFESTKTASNDYIGALGLGSKAPFSYVDSFTVCSWHQGTCYQYAAFLSEQRTPMISLLSQLPTDEANGIEVSLPVKEMADFRVFATKARDVLRWFDVPPVVTGWADFRLPNPKILIEGDGWQIAMDTVDPLAVARAVMGHVAYPVDGAAIDRLSPAAKLVYAMGITIWFPIGALDFTAGRESLSYDPPTLTALERRSMAIIADAPARFQQAFDRCANIYAAHHLYAQLFSSGIAMRLLSSVSTTCRSMLFRGEIIESGSVRLDLTKHQTLTVEHYGDSKRPQRRHDYHAGMNNLLHIPASFDVVILVNDLSSRSDRRSRIAHYRKTNPKLTLFVLLGPADDIASLLQHLEGFPVIHASALERPQTRRQRNAPVQVMRLTMRAFTYGMVQFDSDCWQPATIDPAEGGFFIQRHGHLVLADKHASARFHRVLRHAYELGLLNSQTPIYGFNAPMTKRCTGMPGWIDLPAHLHATLVDRMTNDAALLASMQMQHLEEGNIALVKNRAHLFRLGRALPPEHPIAGFTRTWDDAWGVRKIVRTSEMLRLLCDLLTAPVPDALFAMVRQWVSFRRTYPLLSIFEGDLRVLLPQQQADIEHFAAYVQWIDQTIATAASLQAETNSPEVNSQLHPV